MPEISYDTLPDALRTIGEGAPAPVYLLYGDEFLFKSAYKALLDALIPSAKERTSNCDVFHGATAQIHQIVEDVHTFPLFPGTKVIAVLETGIFASKQSGGELLIQAKEAFEKKDMKKAALKFIQALAIAGTSLQDAVDLGPQKFLRKASARGTSSEPGRDDAWITHLAHYCLDEQMRVPALMDDADILNSALTKGLPKTNHLVLTAEFVDRRKRLYKTIGKAGMIVDCSFVKGTGSAEVRRQKRILKLQMTRAFASAGKEAMPGAFEALYERTGASLRAFNSEVEKLIAFVGDKTAVFVDDVEKTSEKSKQDPVYELSNAVGERNLRKSLVYVDSLLRANLVPLQILAAVVKLLRRLILAKDFIGSLPRTTWRKGIDYRTFQKAVLPEFEKRKADLAFENAHPFVHYKSMTHAENYCLEELASGLELCLDADRRLKTTGQDARLILENLVFRLCEASSVPKDLRCPDLL